MKFNYGVMQGRLSKKIGNKIQAFPSKYWRSEFSKAKVLGLKSIEWTLDYNNLKKNPLLTKKGQLKIKELSKKNSIKINSITCDCFMQKPFWKNKNNQKILDNFIDIIQCCKNMAINYIVLPLVDNGSIINKKDEKKLLNSCKYILKYLKGSDVKVVFESDFGPKKLKNFITKFDKRYFGINYDTGNSAGLDYEIDDEFKFYGKYIYNVHIKDRLKHGKTVRLGNGNTNFLNLFKNLKKIKYGRKLILQTARSKSDRHMEEIKINLLYLKKFHNV